MPDNSFLGPKEVDGNGSSNKIQDKGNKRRRGRRGGEPGITKQPSLVGETMLPRERGIRRGEK